MVVCRPPSLVEKREEMSRMAEQRRYRSWTACSIFQEAEYKEAEFQEQGLASSGPR